MMRLFFRKWFEAAVPMAAARMVRKSLERHQQSVGEVYRPGQFGIEIEFRAGDDNDDDDNDDDDDDGNGGIDYNTARVVYGREVKKKPENPADWAYNHEEPEKPDEDGYQYSETDPVENLWSLNMEREPVSQPLPPAIAQFDENETASLFGKLPPRFLIHMVGEIDEALSMIKNLYAGKGLLSIGYNMLSDTRRLKDWKIRFEAQTNVSSSRFEYALQHQFGGENLYFNRDQVKYLDSLSHAVMEAIKDFVKFHKERAAAITPEEFETRIKELWISDQDSWRKEHEEWEAERKATQEAWDNWEVGFTSWLSQNLARFTIAPNRDGRKVTKDIAEVARWIRLNDGGTGWKVFEDEPGIVEIASPILNVGNLGFVKSLLDSISDKDFDSNTGLHVHIGMPPITDAFDLIAVADLTDEDAIVAMSGRAEYSLTKYSQRKSEFFKTLYQLIPEGFQRTEDLLNLMNQSLKRYFGVNTITAFMTHGTVEIRYLTSQIISQPEKLFKIINYVLMLPQLAKGRNQIKYTMPIFGTIVFTRRPGGIEIHKFPVGAPARVPQSGRPVADLRQPLPTFAQRKSSLLQKYGQGKATDSKPVNNPDDFIWRNDLH